MNTIDEASFHALLHAYLDELDRDLTFQHVNEEEGDPYEKYPIIFSACIEDKIVGMVAYQPLSLKRCEMKRLYVLQDYRNQGIARKLIDAILKQAKEDGYQEMVLDTILPFQAALHLYRDFGFKECEPYYHNPMSDVIYLSKDL